VGHHHPAQLQRSHNAWPSAIQRCQPPQHAQVFQQHEDDIDKRQGADRRNNANPLRCCEDDPFGPLIEWSEDFAIREPRQIAGIAHIGLMLTEAGDAPFQVIASVEAGQQLPKKRLLLCRIARVERILEPTADAPQSVEAHDADRFTKHDGHCRKTGDGNQGNGDPAYDVIARERIEREFGDPQACGEQGEA